MTVVRNGFKSLDEGRCNCKFLFVRNAQHRLNEVSRRRPPRHEFEARNPPYVISHRPGSQKSIGNGKTWSDANTVPVDTAISSGEKTKGERDLMMASLAAHLTCSGAFSTTNLPQINSFFRFPVSVLKCCNSPLVRNLLRKRGP